MAIYTCEVCGKHLVPHVIWSCVEDDEALRLGDLLISNHVHRPDVVPGDTISIGSYRLPDEPAAGASTEQEARGGKS